MKVCFALLATAITVLAAPFEEQAAAPAELAGEATILETCYYKSSCSAFWSGKCEDYCREHDGFSHMDGSECGNIFEKRCCCNKP